MGTTATADRGTLVDSFDELARLLCDCPAWQAWAAGHDDVGKHAALVAAAHVHHVALPRPADVTKGYGKAELEALRPFVVIDFPPPEAEDEEAFVAAQAGGGFFAHRGRLNLRFEADVPAALRGDIAAAKLWMMERLGRVIEDVTGLANTSGYLAVRELRLWCPPVHADEIDAADKGDFFTADLLVSWGLKPRMD